MRGTRRLRSISGRLEALPLTNPAFHALLYGTLFAIVMIYVLCSVRFPIDPSAVEPPYRDLCSFLTVVNAGFAVLLLLDCARVWAGRARRRVLALIPPLAGLTVIACVQIIAERLQYVRVG